MHRLRVEKAVNDLSPEVWAHMARELRDWLRFVLPELRPVMERLVTIEERAVNREQKGFLANFIADITRRRLNPDFSKFVKRFTNKLIDALFLPRDPRRDLVEDFATEILARRSTEIWGNLTNPDTLARKVLEYRDEGLTYGEMSRQIASDYSKQLYVAERLVRTASNGATNNADFERMVQEGVESIEWLTQQDNRVRRPPKSDANHKELDGKVVAVGVPFVTSRGFRMRFPSDQSLGAPLDDVINCRCMIVEA